MKVMSDNISVSLLYAVHEVRICSTVSGHLHGG